MIVRETTNHFICIPQHDHGLLSGKMAFHSGQEPFSPATQQMVLTASLHDSSWIQLDKSLPWNLQANKPYDFIDLPLDLRLQIYEEGLNEIEHIDPYTALLASIHYETFLQHDHDEKARQFISKEHRRQQRLQENLSIEHVSLSLRELQMWDHLSLFTCLHQPGTGDTVPWYKAGIPGITMDHDPIMIQASWLNDETVALDPFPFREPWTAKIPYYQCRKSLGKKDPDKNQRHYHFVTFVSRKS